MFRSTSFRGLSVAFLLVFILVSPSGAQSQSCDKVEFIGPWDNEPFEAMLEKFHDEYPEVCVVYTPIQDMGAYWSLFMTRTAAGNAPGISYVPNLSMLAELASGDLIISLDEMLGGEYAEYYEQSWRYYGSLIRSYEEAPEWFGLPVNAFVLSNPWLYSLYDGDPTGSAAPLIIHDILIQNIGARGADGLAGGDLPWNDDAVAAAWKTYFDAIDSGEVFDLYAPEWYESNPLQVSGQYVVAFKDSEAYGSGAAKTLMQFLASSSGANAWADSGLGLSPNLQVESIISSAPTVSFAKYGLLPDAENLYSVEFDQIQMLLAAGNVTTGDIQDALGILEEAHQEYLQQREGVYAPSGKSTLMARSSVAGDSPLPDETTTLRRNPGCHFYIYEYAGYIYWGFCCWC